MATNGNKLIDRSSNTLSIEQMRKEQAEIKRKKKKQKEKERIEAIHRKFMDWLTLNGLAYVREYYFNKAKKYGEPDWHSDFYLPELNLIIEVEGGIWNNGGHVRPIGYLGDIDKYNAITMADIKLLRIDTDRLNSYYFKQLILTLKDTLV